MKLEQQVCSLELAKRLKELGVKQDSLFNWVNTKVPRIEDSRIVGCGRCGSVLNGIPVPMTVERFSAYTVAELGDILPDDIANGGDHALEILKMPIKGPNQWLTRYCCEIMESCFGAQFGETLADSMAKVVIYLLENKLIEL